MTGKRVYLETRLPLGKSQLHRFGQLRENKVKVLPEPFEVQSAYRLAEDSSIIKSVETRIIIEHPDDKDLCLVTIQGDVRVSFVIKDYDETPVFDGIKEHEIQKYLKDANLPLNAKTHLYDGQTGERFDQLCLPIALYAGDAQHFACLDV